jgi:hypothetical protein
VPIVLLLVLAAQLGSGLLRSNAAVRSAVAIGRVSLEADPAGARVELVVVDRAGADTTVTGAVTIRVREPDGSVWQTTRQVAASDFTTLPAGHLLAGRLGLSVLVPSGDWARPPRRGGAATVSVSIQPSEGEPFSTVAEERFP